MSRTILKVSIGCTSAALLAVAGWYLFRDFVGPHSPSAEPASVPDSARSSRASAADAPRPPAGSPNTSLAPRDNFNARYLQSRDLLAFAEGLLDAAKAGDGASRYWLYRALDECSAGFGESHSLEETLIYAAQDAVDAELIRDWFARCEVLRGPRREDFGDPKAWLQAAVEAGYPLAQVQKALQLQSQAKRDAANAQGLRAESRTLALEALASGDPAVMASIGRLAAVTQPHEKKFDLADAWLLAACLRGFDCGEHSEYFPMWCRKDPACQPFETVADLMRRSYGAEFNAVESKALAINEYIDAGRFDNLGF
jgi:hypothetical protein